MVEMNYSEELKNILFGTLTLQEIEEYVALIGSIPPGKVSKTVSDDYKKRKNDLQNMHGMRIHLSPKVDSKGQRRVQCAIPRIDQLWEQFPQLILHRTTDQVRGIPITTTYASTPRVRKAKGEPKEKREPKVKKLITKD
jgi:hypothetical protein